MADAIYQIDARTVSEALEYFERCGVTPISLRELFLRRRGAKQEPKNACVLMMRLTDQDGFSDLYTAIKRTDTKIALTIETVLTAAQCEKLLHVSHINVVPAYTYANKNDAVVFCETVNANTVQVMRKNGVRMVLTTDKPPYGKLPNGMDVLYAQPFSPCTDQDASSTKNDFTMITPDAEPMFSDLHLAIPLSMIGTDRELLACTLASHAWKTTYFPSQDRYTVDFDFTALQTVLYVPQGDACTALKTKLSHGVYVWIKLQSYVHSLGGAESLLLYGYDDSANVFLAYTSTQKGTYERIALLPETVAQLCATNGTSILLCGLDRTETVLDTDAFAESLREETALCGNVYHGREASVRYANRFYKRFAHGKETLSASSLRTFLQERKRIGFALWYHAEQNDYYLPVFEEHIRMLAKQVGDALCDLQGKEALAPEMPIFLTSELMRNLLNAEDAAVSAFLDEYDRAQYRRKYLKKTCAKNDRL